MQKIITFFKDNSPLENRYYSYLHLITTNFTLFSNKKRSSMNYAMHIIKVIGNIFAGDNMEEKLNFLPLIFKLNLQKYQRDFKTFWESSIVQE
jgi:hypothetical protein